ncbi:hypothetical protein Ciccas_008642 [Cichlidogyrus casuarinus]|uniref:PMP-22/EMP/MP20/Claudin tight junction n=1 Tax=Cichlidogyrus casuarinus TaxID=1844966 RepID=A0ABD2PZB1_9PLAT
MCEWCCNIPVNNPPKNKRSFFGYRRYAFCILISFLSFVCLFISFVTPYWIQSWPRIHTPIKRIGLWEYCLNGYKDRLDQSVVSYFDCWWILSPYVGKPYNYLVPFWFIIIQVLVTIAIIIQLATHILLIVHLLKGIRRIERRAYVLRFVAIFHGLTVACLFPSIVIFGANWDNPNWVPYPNLNWPSWSYGFAILSCILSVICVFMLIFIIQENDRRNEEAFMNFPMNLQPNQVARTKYNLATSQTALGLGDVKSSQPEKYPLMAPNYAGSALSGSQVGSGSIPRVGDPNYYRQPQYQNYDEESVRSYPRDPNEYQGQYINSQPYNDYQQPRQGGYYDDRNRRLILERPENQYGSEMSA